MYLMNTPCTRVDVFMCFERVEHREQNNSDEFTSQKWFRFISPCAHTLPHTYNPPRLHWVQHPSLSEVNLPLENSPIAQMRIS